jgi:hypothetical protein
VIFIKDTYSQSNHFVASAGKNELKPYPECGNVWLFFDDPHSSCKISG